MIRLVCAAILVFGLVRPALADAAAALAAIRLGDYPAAYQACKDAVEQGDAECQNLVGVLFRQGLGVPTNVEEAVRLFRLAAGKKLAAAQNNLGFAYLGGLGVPSDDAQAAQWFALSTAQGDPLGELQLALLTLAGRGVEKDAQKAVTMLQHSAGRGYLPAQLTLASIYENAHGKWHQPQLAYTWYRIAQRTAPNPVLRGRAADGVNRLVLQLSGQEIASAQRIAGLWKPSGPSLEFGPFGARPAAAANPGAKPTSFGSGILVSREGDVVTNNHVVTGCTDITVQHNGKPLTARVSATDAAADLAILHLAEPVEGIAHFHQSGAAMPGEAVVVVGYPLHGLLTSDAIVTTGIVSALAGLRNDKKELQITAPVQPGNSGGPLIDASGAVIGVVVGKLNGLKVAEATGAIPENINFAIHVELVRALLDKAGVKYQTSAATEPLPTPTIAAEALKYTVAVQCRR